MLQPFKKIFLIVSIFISSPVLVFAQFGGETRITEFIENIILFITNVLTPFVFAVALLFFVYGMYLFFIQGGDDERKTGRKYLLWAIIALVLMASVWGITNLIAGGLNFDDPTAIDGLIPKAGEIR